MVAFCVFGPRSEYHILNPNDKGLYDIGPQPEYRINNLDNKVFRASQTKVTIHCARCGNIQFGPATSSSELLLG
jgi:hypothetical protein